MNNISNNHAEHDISPDERKKRDGRRRGEISRFRVIYGVKAILCKPWKIIFVALLGVEFLFCWLNRDIAMSFMSMNFATPPDSMAQIVSYTANSLVLVLFMLLLAFVLYMLGIPRKVRKINRMILDFFKSDVGYGYWPIYLSCRREGNTDLWRYEFYSEYLPIETWEAKSARLVNMLGGYIDSISNGGKAGNDVRYIIVVSGSGAKPKERAATPDPLFRK